MALVNGLNLVPEPPAGNYTFFNHFLFIKRQHILKLLYLNTIIYASINFSKKMKNNNYQADSIKVLKGLEAVEKDLVCILGIQTMALVFTTWFMKSLIIRLMKL